MSVPVGMHPTGDRTESMTRASQIGTMNCALPANSMRRVESWDGPLEERVIRACLWARTRPMRKRMKIAEVRHKPTGDVSVSVV